MIDFKADIATRIRAWTQPSCNAAEGRSGCGTGDGDA